MSESLSKSQPHYSDIWHGSQGRFIVVRARYSPNLNEWVPGDYVEHATDNVVEALLHRSLLAQTDDGTSWNARQVGPWQVIDTSIPNWEFSHDAAVNFQD